MKNLIFTIILSLVFIACNQKEKNSNISVPKVDTKDSIKNPDTIKPEINDFFENEIRDLTNFDFKIDFPEFDKIYNQIKTKKTATIKVNLKEDCLGDACYTSKIFKNGNEIIKISKMDCGEYGFGNYEFYYKDSILKYYRQYNLSVLEFPDENIETLWGIEEIQYIFEGKKVLIRKRKRHTRNLNGQYRLNMEKYEIKNVSISEIKKELDDIKKQSEDIN